MPSGNHIHTILTEISCEARPPKGKSHAQHVRESKIRKGIIPADPAPFLAWDGEGITRNGAHFYVFLMNSNGGCLYSVAGLSREAVFHFLMTEAERFESEHKRKPIHVIYGGGYDFNMWLKGTKRELIDDLYHGKRVCFPQRVGAHYFTEWRSGKFFQLSRGPRTVRMYDVVSFFQRPFVAACDEYLKERFEDRDLIVKNKALRSSFTDSDIDEMREYTGAELRNLVLLMDTLRQALTNADLRPNRWDGPGAVAARLLKNHRVKGFMYDADYQPPEAVSAAVRTAYAGGRFEQLKYGAVSECAYEYDVNSAYPSALRFVPCLRHGQWIHNVGDAARTCHEFAVYRLRYRAKAGTDHLPQPLFCRNANGTITYPTAVEGWYWNPEFEAASRYVERYGGRLEVLESWHWEHDPAADCHGIPFHFIEGLFNKRRALKKAGDGAHFGIKLGLNSLYGKLAQQLGYDESSGRIPPFHQLEWAGFTTSHCRATVLTAALEDIESVIAFETDALFTARPLSVKAGSALGEFEALQFDTLAYCQSGMYFYTADGETKVKSRGIDRGAIQLEDMLTAMRTHEPMTATSTRFYGAGLALSQDWSKWCTWQRAPKSVQVGPTLEMKRAHGEVTPCPVCVRYGRDVIGMWHPTTVAHHTIGHGGPLISHEFPILWANASPEMGELAVFRRQAYDRWDEE